MVDIKLFNPNFKRPGMITKIRNNRYKSNAKYPIKLILSVVEIFYCF